MLGSSPRALKMHCCVSSTAFPSWAWKAPLAIGHRAFWFAKIGYGLESGVIINSTLWIFNSTLWILNQLPSRPMFVKLHRSMAARLCHCYLLRGGCSMPCEVTRRICCKSRWFLFVFLCDLEQSWPALSLLSSPNIITIFVNSFHASPSVCQLLGKNGILIQVASNLCLASFARLSRRKKTPALNALNNVSSKKRGFLWYCSLLQSGFALGDRVGQHTSVMDANIPFFAPA